MVSTEEKYPLPNNGYLGYKQYKPTKETEKPGLIFLSGWSSNMNGNKAEYLEKYCRLHELTYTRFDYNGHTFSSGNMDEFTVGLGVKNTEDILDNLTSGCQILVGSSVGGWIALLTALKRPERIHSILTINNAADFVYKRFQRKYEGKVNMDDIYDKNGFVEVESGFRVSKTCIEDAKSNCLLALPSIEITCPVTLIHAIQDEVIPYQTSIELAEKLKSSNVEVRLIKNATHRFSEDENLNVIRDELDKLLKVNSNVTEELKI